jgi:hypothetical protein
MVITVTPHFYLRRNHYFKGKLLIKSGKRLNSKVINSLFLKISFLRKCAYFLNELVTIDKFQYIQPMRQPNESVTGDTSYQNAGNQIRVNDNTEHNNQSKLPSRISCTALFIADCFADLLGNVSKNSLMPCAAFIALGFGDRGVILRSTFTKSNDSKYRSKASACLFSLIVSVICVMV